MIWGNPIIALLGALALLVLSAAVQDARMREIANWKNGAIALLAPLWWWALGLQWWPDIALLVAVALIVFGLFCIAYARGWMGGGDVKMIGALALWCVHFTTLAWLLILMSLIGGVLTLVLVIDQWRRKETAPIEVPYGVAIAISAAIVLSEPIFNQFHR